MAAIYLLVGMPAVGEAVEIGLYRHRPSQFVLLLLTTVGGV